MLLLCESLKKNCPRIILFESKTRIQLWLPKCFRYTCVYVYACIFQCFWMLRGEREDMWQRRFSERLSTDISGKSLRNLRSNLKIFGVGISSSAGQVLSFVGASSKSLPPHSLRSVICRFPLVFRENWSNLERSINVDFASVSGNSYIQIAVFLKKSSKPFICDSFTLRVY